MEIDRGRLKKSAEVLGMKIEFDSDNSGIHIIDEEGNESKKTFDEIQKEISNVFKYNKINRLIELIEVVDGKEVHRLAFIDKDDNWLNHHIDYYEYALNLNK